MHGSRMVTGVSGWWGQGWAEGGGVKGQEWRFKSSCSFLSLGMGRKGHGSGGHSGGAPWVGVAPAKGEGGKSPASSA